MKYYQCSAQHKNTFYTWSHFDFETNDPNEIIEALKERGYDDVVEIWDIEEQ